MSNVLATWMGEKKLIEHRLNGIIIVIIQNLVCLAFPPHCLQAQSLTLPSFQWVVASLIFQLPSESDTLNTPNTSFSTSHLFRSPLSPLLGSPLWPPAAISSATHYIDLPPQPTTATNLPQFPLLYCTSQDEIRFYIFPLFSAQILTCQIWLFALAAQVWRVALSCIFRGTVATLWCWAEWR